MRQVIIYGVLLFVMLGAAWVHWTAEPGTDTDDAVVVLAGDVEGLESVAWKGEDDEVTVTRKSDAHGDYLWVEYVKWEEVELEGPALPAPDADEGDAAEDEAAEDAAEDAAAEDAAAEDAAAEDAADVVQPEVERTAKRTVFKASAKGQELLAKLAPLHAIRRLDQVDDDKLAEIGLDAPKASLTITRKGTSVTLEIGGEAYGTKDRYVRDTASGAVYLLDDQLLKDLQYARTRLPDRTLWSMETPAVASAVIATDKGTVEVSQKNPDDPKAAGWVRGEGGDTDEQITTWMDKALKLKGTTYVDPDADDGPQDLVSRFKLTLRPTDGKPETLEVLQAGDSDGDWYGRSEHTRGLLKLLRAPTRAVADDVDALVD